jgi:hypothetical protein
MRNKYMVAIPISELSLDYSKGDHIDVMAAPEFKTEHLIITKWGADELDIADALEKMAFEFLRAADETKRIKEKYDNDGDIHNQ